MSWLPLYNAWVVFTVIVSLFLWKLLGVLFFLFAVSVSVLYLLGEVLPVEKRYTFAFWLFILSEVAAFGSLFWVLAWSYDSSLNHISDFMELPLLGCFLLIGSSFTITAYHHCIGFRGSELLIVLTVLLGFGFVVLQIWEFYDCECDLLGSVYQAVSFCIVGLHFSHVAFGLVALSILLWIGQESLEMYHINLAVWYWHFVDYVWLFVFTLVYVV